MREHTDPTLAAAAGNVAEILSGAGVVLTRFLFNPGEPCNHDPMDALVIVNHLATVGPGELHACAASLARLERAGCHAWSDSAECPLCARLRALARSAG